MAPLTMRCEKYDRLDGFSVVISVFNGERYLTQQVDSIIKELPDIKFYIRDDGSTDGTVSLVHELFKYRRHNLAYFEFGTNNLGPALSYFRLISKTSERYIFLADQDDVWIPGRARELITKISALEMLSGTALPALVFSDAQVVDRDLNILHKSFWRYESNHPYGRVNLNSALTQNLSPGCTMLINKELASLCPMEDVQDVIMHDWWILILAFCYGHVGYCDLPTLKYRQHGQNVIGAKKNQISLLSLNKQIRLSKSSIDKTFLQARSILRFYQDMPDTSLEVIRKYVSIFDLNPLARRYALLKHRFLKSSFRRNVGLFLLV